MSVTPQGDGPGRARPGPARPNRFVARPARAERKVSLERAWCAYNWADHGWATPVAAVLAGPWMLSLADNAVGKRGVLIGVGPVVLRADAFPSAMITMAAVLQLVLLPGLGARIDARAAKRRWLAGSCATGVAVCLGLGLTAGGAWAAAGLLFLLGSVAEGVSDLTWQGMLPEIADPGRRDGLSALGTAVGYLGAGLLLIGELALVDGHADLGLSKSLAVRVCFAFAGLWWAAFALPSLRRLRPPSRGEVPAPRRAIRRLRADLRALGASPQSRKFLLAYLLFGDAMSAVIALASTFLTHELFADNTTKATPFLFELILLIQFIAMAAAVATGAAVRWVRTKTVLVGTLALWTAVIFYAWAGLHTRADAVLAGSLIGVGLGSTTTLARSMFSQQIPVGSEATFFSLYEICSQGTSFVAPLLFTVVVDVTGSFRQAILSLVLLFAAGMIVLIRTDTDAAAAEAATASPGTAQPPLPSA